jgi:hypothetical protein
MTVGRTSVRADVDGLTGAGRRWHPSAAGDEIN